MANISISTISLTREMRDSFDLMEEMFEDFRRNCMMPYSPIWV